MAQRMTRTKAILAQIQEHLGLPPILAFPQAAIAPPPASPTTPSADLAPIALLAASAALQADHLVVFTESHDEDEVPPPTAT